MTKAIPYLDIYVEDIGAGHKIYFIGLDNSIVDTKTHYPWFTVYSEKKLPEPSLKEVEDGIPLIYDPALFLYVPKPELRVYKGYASHRSKVPEAVASLLNRYNVKAGLYNIKYEARVALDFSKTHHLLGVPSPLVFLPNSKMVRIMEEVIEKLGDLKVMAVDIEVYSTSGGFPRQGDPILTITYTVFKLKDNIFDKEWPEKNVKVLSIKNAKDVSEMKRESMKLVERFFEILRKERPNVIVTYNGTGFDFPYMKPFVTRNYYIITKNVIGIWRPEKNERILIPHIDLMLVREYLGSSMGIRSHAAYALDDVALEVAESLRKFYNIDWLFESDYIKAERLLNHAKLKEYWERNDPLFHNYIVADVYLTALIARVWLYSLFILSVLTGMPPTLVQSMNTGQIAEYLAVELLARLGFYPELRTRTMEYSRTTDVIEDSDGWVFNRGKVYVHDYGVYGGSGKKIVELDFAQLYPSDMVANSTDPTMFFIKEGSHDGTPVDRTLNVPAEKYRVAERQTTIILGRKPKKSSSTIKTRYILKIVPGYGPISWFVYKLYTARKETKKLKKRAKTEKRVELLAPDQAIKILNNSFYGAFSKSRGNLINEAISATVFWRTQKLLYEVIDFINKELPKKLGKDVKVLYGDTDSAYVMVDEDVDIETLVKEVNNWIQQRYGPFYYMELEDVYDLMVIPKQKDKNSPSAKSYICLKGGKPAKVKGEFYKLVAPLAIKERLLDFYIEIIKRRPRSKKELKQIVKSFIENQPIHKWFIKKSISSFVNEDDTRKLKKLNREFHYAALYSLTMYKSPGVTILDTNAGTLAPFVNDKGWRTIRVRIDPREVERTQRAVIVHYLPHPSGDPKKFLVYVSDDGNTAIVHLVALRDLRVEVEGTDEDNAVEKYFVATFAYREIKLPRTVLLDKVLDTLDKYVITPVYKKLIPALTRVSRDVWVA